MTDENMDDIGQDFRDCIQGTLAISAQDVHGMLAKSGIHIFAIRIDGRYVHGEYMLWVHPHKTTAEWRDDVRVFLKGYGSGQEGEGCNDRIVNALFGHLRGIGYHEVMDVVSDVYEGRMTCEKSRIVDEPDHEEQLDGFGHFGWENIRQDTK